MADQSFDYIIVGGGTAGCVVASRLRQGDPSKTVLLVERGPDERKHPQITSPLAAPLIPVTTNLVSKYDTNPQPGLANRTVLNLAGNILSGSSSVNYGMWSRGDKADYEQWAKSSGDGRWTYERMMPYFNRSEHHHDPDVDPKFHGFDGPIHTVSGRRYPLRDTIYNAFHAAGYQDNQDANSGNPLGLAKYTENWHEAIRQPAGTAYPLEGVQVMTNTTVHKLTLKDHPATGNMVATGIELLSGRQIHARKEVIVSCGAHRTPQLLMLSGIGDEIELAKHGIHQLANSHFVGHNLFDHLALGFAWKLKPSVQERGAALGHHEWENNPSNAEGMPMEWIVHASVRPSALLPALQADGELLTAPKQFLLKERAHTMMLVAYGPMALGPNHSVPMDGSHISSIALLYQPTSRGSLTLSSANPEDPPIIDPAYYATQADKVMLRSAVRDILRVMELPSMQEVIECESPPEGYPPLTSKSSDGEIDARVAGFGTTIHHAAGTCAMGNVVDGQLRVKGVDGLRLVDASVFPAPVSGGLQASVYAVAELASDLILGDTKKEAKGTAEAITPSELASEMIATVRDALPDSVKARRVSNPELIRERGNRAEVLASGILGVNIRTRTSISRSHPHACRFIAGRRSPFPQRSLHTSPTPRREEDPPDAAWNSSVVQSVDVPGSEQTSFVTETTAEDPNGASDNPPKPKDRSNYGSASRRAARNVKPREKLPPVYIPPWFLDRNVVLRGDRARTRIEHGPVTLTQAGGLPSDQGAQGEGQTGAEDTSPVKDASESEGLDDRQLEIDTGLSSKSRPAPPLLDTTNMREISSIVSAGLQVPSWYRAENFASPKPHVVLFCPKNGGTSVLDAIGLQLAEENSTDFLRFTPQDIAEIGGDYMDDSSTFRVNTLSSLGYDAQLATAMRSPQGSEESPEEEDYDESEEEEIDQNPGKPRYSVQGRVGGFNAIHVGTIAASSLQDLLKPFISQAGSPQQPKLAGIKPAVPIKDMTPEMKMTMLVETLLNAPEIKRVAENSAMESSTADAQRETAEVSSPVAQDSPDEASESPFRDAERGSEGLIILIQDYLQINTTVNGGKFLDKLHEVVETRRREGQRVLIVGTTSSKELMPSFSRSGVDHVQRDPRDLPTRTIITPINEVSPEHTFARHHKEETKSINMRHLKDMLRRTAPVPGQVAAVISDRTSHVDSKTTFLSGLEDSVWSFDRVSRAARTALGLLEGSEELTIKHIEQALDIIESSDTVKADWVMNEKERREKETKFTSSVLEIDSKERMRKLRRTCNEHEKKLLNGVVDPENIRTTFADVQASPQTIDALKTLTSLSLVRPDAFTYGVLATDRIPGLLLYGPPGTGKTLLAKAVAKESGATVLEVSGSDVYDMYVGEGEKNVRAIFTLAKKLTPCIVFIDEADAILGARTGGGNRTSHRELINQFLREWDGMTELSAFIMVATNRPFDLDEASLRRLPRRLLVDLPVEKDREAILKIHLQSERLDPDVSIANLASQTPFYSGSDLKNVCVAAALACVREEFDTAASLAKDTNTNTNKAEKKYEYPEKRTLRKRHFDKAMEEISASISEDMGSLSAIRKFDEKYGDRRGRRKKAGFGYRTGGVEGDKVGSDAARVRN